MSGRSGSGFVISRGHLPSLLYYHGGWGPLWVKDLSSARVFAQRAEARATYEQLPLRLGVEVKELSNLKPRSMLSMERAVAACDAIKAAANHRAANIVRLANTLSRS